MVRQYWCVLGLALAFAAVPALALPVTLNASAGSWVSVPNCVSGACYTDLNRPYWVNVSQDDGLNPDSQGRLQTLASIINNTSQFTTLPNFTNAQWYGNADGSAVRDLSFTGGGPYNLNLLLADTGNQLIFGYYTIGTQNGQTVPVFGQVLFTAGGNGTASVLSLQAQFNPGSAQWGFFVKYGNPVCAAQDWRAVCSGSVLDHVNGTGVPLDVYYTQSSLNKAALSADDWAAFASLGLTDAQKANLAKAIFESGQLNGVPLSATEKLNLAKAITDSGQTNGLARQHYSLVNTDQGLVIGMEDGWSGYKNITTLSTPSGPVWEQGGDYNDMVIVLTPVPEPSSIALIGLGFSALAGTRLIRRRKTT